MSPPMPDRIPDLSPASQGGFPVGWQAVFQGDVCTEACNRGTEMEIKKNTFCLAQGETNVRAN